MNTPPPLSFSNRYGPSYGTPSTPSQVDRRRNTTTSSSLESTPLSPMSTRPPVWSNVDLTPRYSEMPQHGRKRRRRQGGPDLVAKWTTRVVLASPLLVLVLWSVAVVLHAGKNIPVQEQKQGAVLSAKKRSSTRRRMVPVPPRPIPHMKKTTNTADLQGMIVQPPIPANQQDVSPERKSIPVIAPLGSSSSHVIPIIESGGEVVMKALGSKQGGGSIPVVVPLGAVGSKQGGESIPVVVPLGAVNGQQSNPSTGSDVNVSTRPRPKPRGVSSQFNTNEALMLTQDGNALGATQQEPEAMAAVQNSANQMMAAHKSADKVHVGTRPRPKPRSSQFNTNDAMMLLTQDGNALGATLGQPEMMAAVQNGANQVMAAQNAANEYTSSLENSQHKMMATENAMKATQESGAVMMQTGNAMTRSNKSPKIYFYDAAGSTKNGQLYVPEIVYDVNGNPVRLASLNDGRTEIYLEPPKMGLQVDSPQKELNVKEKIQEKVQAQDQMIIIATVATMAILVGALSARRMRSRQFLSSCIENESLEDEVAYDTAYTTSAAASTTSYDTFGASHWRGDLEKFDV